jgi:hypothetical protein
MPKYCGYTVYILLTSHWIRLGQLYTVVSEAVIEVVNRVEQVVVTHSIIPQFTYNISPSNYRYLPLYEHYLYPVSTSPTISNIKEN